MNRRSFLVRAAGAVPVLSVLAAARRPKETTLVTVIHDGDKPVSVQVTGDILLGSAGLKYYERSAPLTVTTPVDFYVNVENHPTTIEPAGQAFIRVKADRQMSNQHLYARAHRVIIRKQGADLLSKGVSRIEIVGEAAPPK